MAYDGTLVFDTRIDTKGFGKGIDTIKGKTDGLSASLKKLGALIASVFAVQQIVNFGKQAIELGSNVAEVQNVVDVAFGDMAYMVDEFAKSAIENFGMSQLAAKKTASTYMAMARGMGVAMDTAAEMSLTLTGLSGDVASFYNISQEEAAYKLQSVFTGETESLKELGIVMTEVNLEQYAMANGMNSNIQSMTQAQRVALNYAFVTDQLALASGDFVRTQDSWANQTRILSMLWQEFMSIVGQALIQVLLPVVRTLNQIVSTLISMANALNAALASIFGGASTQIQQTQADVGGVASGIDSAVDNQEALTDATKETNKEQKKSLSTFDEINKLSTETASSSGSGGVSSAGGVGASTGVSSIPALETKTVDVQATGGEKLIELFDRLKQAVEPFRSSFETAFDSIETGAQSLFDVFYQAWSDIKSLGTPLYEWFGGSFTTFINQFIVTFGNTLGGLLDTVAMVFSDIWSIAIFPAIQKWISDIGPALTDFFTAALSTFDVLFNSVKTLFDTIWQDAIKPSLEIFYNIWSDTWDGIIAAWEEHGKPIFDKIKEAIKGTADTLLNIWDTIFKPTWDKIMEVVSELWENHVKPLWDNLLDFAGSLAELALNIYNNFILPLVNWFVDTFGPPISEIVSGIIGVVGDLLGKVIDVASGIISRLTEVVDFLSDVFMSDWNEVFDNISKHVKSVINAMIGFVESFVNSFIRGVNKVVGALNTLNVDVPDWVPGIGGNSFGFNIPSIPEIKLPRLATGAVIPPNREFLAVLGDQKQGTNIEAPLDTIVQAFKQAIAESGYSGSNEAYLVLNEQVLGKVVYRLNNKESNRIGVSLVRGGQA